MSFVQVVGLLRDSSYVSSRISEHLAQPAAISLFALIALYVIVPGWWEYWAVNYTRIAQVYLISFKATRRGKGDL